MKKKGFTLIELLAVLVVLAILALISIPLVIGIIRNARVKSNERSIEAYGRAVENAVGVYLLNNPNEQPTTISLTSLDIQTSGQTVKCDGNVIINTNGSIRLENCYVEDSNPKYNYDNKKLEKISNSTTTYKVYSVGDTFTLSGDSYHIIADSSESQDYVVALKDTPLTVSEITAPDGVTVNDNLGDGSVGGVPYHASSGEYSISYVKQIVEAWTGTKFKNSELKTVDGYSARLIQLQELTGSLGYEWTDNGSFALWKKTESTPNWVYNSAYWTMSSEDDSSSIVWCVNNNGSLGRNYNVGYASEAVRPVINVYKDKLPE